MESSPFELGNYTVCISSSSWGKRGVLQPTAAKLVTPEQDILLKSGRLQLLLLPCLSCWRKQPGFLRSLQAPGYTYQGHCLHSLPQ